MRKALKRLLGRKPLGLAFNDHIAGDGPSIYAHACRMGLEGIVSKRCDSLYRSGRGKDWLKIKCSDRQEFVIAGWEPSDDGKLLAYGLANAGSDWPLSGKFGAQPKEADEIVAAAAQLGVPVQSVMTDNAWCYVQRRYAELRQEEKARSWIYGITRRVVSTQRRRRRATCDGCHGLYATHRISQRHHVYRVRSDGGTRRSSAT